MEKILFGVTHECKYPENAKTKPCVINSAINSDKLTSKEIDSQICQLLKEQKEIFILNEKNLLEARPDLIISQETCEACAAHKNHVTKAMEILPTKPMIHSMNPHNLQEIVESVAIIGKIIEKEDEAMEITKDLKKRIDRIKETKSQKKLKVLALEWIEPFFTAGHWVPEMISNAGGRNMISKIGEQSRKLTITEIIKSDPDIIIMMPCGFDMYRTIAEYNKILKRDEKWNMLRAVRNNNIFVVDANSYFSKPSIRTITGLEILAKIIRPTRFLNLTVPKNSFLQLK